MNMLSFGRAANRSEAPASDEAALRAAMAQVSRVCAAAARGDLEQRILNIHDDGPIGAMQRDINHLLDMTDAFVREASASLTHAAEEKFYRRVLTRGMRGSFRHGAELINAATEQAARLAAQRVERVRLSDAFEDRIKEVVHGVASTATEAEATARSLMESAESTSQEAEVAASSAVDTSQHMATVASASAQIAGAAAEIEKQVEHSRVMAEQALAEAKRANEVVSGLESASRDITRVVGIINEVALQTRLLALNAMIEAAHVGDAGLGFAVVAAEVNNLATRTAKATGEIELMVETIQTATAGAVGATAGIATTVTGMHTLLAGMRRAVGAQGEATVQMGVSINRAVEGTRRVSDTVATAAEGSVQTQSAADEMVQSASDLSRVAESLMGDVDQFLGQMRKR